MSLVGDVIYAILIYDVLKDSSSLELVEAIRAVHLGRKYLSQKLSDIVLQEISEIKKDTDEIGVDLLTNRECEILQLISEGNATKIIAEVLFISPKTVESHRANIMEKLNIYNIPALTKYAIQAGLTFLDKYSILHKFLIGNIPIRN